MSASAEQKSPKLTTRKQKALLPCFVLLVVLCYFAFAYQVKRNARYYQLRTEEIRDALSGRFAHPMLILTPGYRTHARAFYYLTTHPERRYWVIDEWLDAAILLNYYVHPVELRKAVRTQKTMTRIWLSKTEEQVSHYPPKSYEKIIYIDVKSMKVLDEWDGSL